MKWEAIKTGMRRSERAHIGLEALVRVISHPALQGIPFILETPNDDEGWTKEIRLLRESAENLVL